MEPRAGEFTLREEDILKTIKEQGSSIAVVIFSGIQYYTGQWFPMQRITAAAKEQVRGSHVAVLSIGLTVCRVVSADGISHMRSEMFLCRCTTGTLISLYGAPTSM